MSPLQFSNSASSEVQQALSAVQMQCDQSLPGLVFIQLGPCSSLSFSFLHWYKHKLLNYESLTFPVLHALCRRRLHNVSRSWCYLSGMRWSLEKLSVRLACWCFALLFNICICQRFNDSFVCFSLKESWQQFRVAVMSSSSATDLPFSHIYMLLIDFSQYCAAPAVSQTLWAPSSGFWSCVYVAVWQLDLALLSGLYIMIGVWQGSLLWRSTSKWGNTSVWSAMIKHLKLL